MNDKVQKIKEWIGKQQDGLMDADGNFRSAADEASYNILCNLDAYIDTLQKEPVSDDLEEAATLYAKEECRSKNPATLPDRCIGCYEPIMYAFRNGANWREEQMMANAVDVTIAIPCQNLDGSYTQLVDSNDALPFGDKLKVLVIKED